MRWDPFNDGIAIKPLGRYAPDYYGKRAPATATSHKNRVGVLLATSSTRLQFSTKKSLLFLTRRSELILSLVTVLFTLTLVK